MPADKLHKLQRWTPDTCDELMQDFEIFDALAEPFDPPQFESRSVGGCQLLQYWDSLHPEIAPVVVGYDQLCPAHEVLTDAGAGKILWHTGNWKDKDKLIAEQRDWFLHLNHKTWLAEGKSLASMPPQIRRKSVEPITPPTLATPSQAEIDDLGKVAGWNQSHNARKGNVRTLLIDDIPSVDMDLVTYTWTGIGDDRVLLLNTNGQLNNAQINVLQAGIDIQSGPGTVVVS